MFTLAFKILVYRHGQLTQTIDDHQVTFDSPAALAEAMIVLAATGTGMVGEDELIDEIFDRNRCRPMLPSSMLKSSIGPNTRIVIHSATPVTLPVPEGLHELDGQTAVVAAMAMNAERRDQVIKLRPTKG